MVKLGEDRLNEIFGTAEEMHLTHERMRRDVLFLWTNMEQWRHEYMDKWIAVYDQKVIAVAPDLASIDRAVRKLPVPRGEVILQPVRPSFANLVTSAFPSPSITVGYGDSLFLRLERC